MGLILGIESSCDDMAAAVVRDGREILASVVSSQDAVHRPYGGVVPELASRDHVRNVQATVSGALGAAEVRLEALDAIAVTTGPGLIGSLLVGLCFAKGLAYTRGLPLIGVHHIEGHLASARLGESPVELPFLGLVVSGGHSALYEVTTLARIRLLGQTRDDAAGEAFDKVAKRLGLGYPGGREVDRCARLGRAGAFAFPRPLTAQPGLELSFSGLKTAVALEIACQEAACGTPLPLAVVADLCASFQEAVIDVLREKTRRALEETGLRRLAVVGGLAANTRLREALAELGTELDVETCFPPGALCTDNAAMVAAVAQHLYEAGVRAPLDLDAFSRAPLPALVGAPTAPHHGMSPEETSHDVTSREDAPQGPAAAVHVAGARA
jgi:N6-L-threonylcarbamoyladenine synthase